MTPILTSLRFKSYQKVARAGTRKVVFLAFIVTGLLFSIWNVGFSTHTLRNAATAEAAATVLTKPAPSSLRVIEKEPNSASFSKPDDEPQFADEKSDASLTTPTKIRVAHVISLITCHRAQRVTGFLDALMILRHSIHQNSRAYGYQMYAMVHRDGGCLEHVPLLERLGYTALVVDTPVSISEIPNDWYRKHVENENCCGSKEFIKLYAYTLMDHPIVVHWDLDVAVLKPMDDLYDSMLFDKDSPRGRAARERLLVQRPAYSRGLPDRIDAFVTRDITSTQPGEKVSAVQGGFVVARPSLEHFEMYRQFILEGNYTKGRGPGSGWGGMGYGGFQGAMAYQGVLAYFYDHVYPGHHVELDVCHWNQVVADVIWRGPSQNASHGQCREYPPQGVAAADNTPENGLCHDCRILPIDQTYTAHYTACKKPWDCRLPHPRKPRDTRQTYRLQQLTNITTCGLLFERYFQYRQQVEALLEAQGVPQTKADGSFHPEYFLGYCKGANGYSPIGDLPNGFDMKQVYGF